MLNSGKVLVTASLFIGLSAVVLPAVADNEIPTRHFGTPHHSMRYDMRADNDMPVQYMRQRDKADCTARYMTICWAQKLPPKLH